MLTGLTAAMGEKMKILITGAFGNLGLMCVEQALAQGYEVRCFDLLTSKNKKTARRFGRRIEVFFGDIGDKAVVKQLVKGVDGVIHNASILPPLTETNPEFSKEVNVEGTTCLIRCAEEENPSMRFVFPSSVTVYGLPTIGESPRTSEDSVEPTDHYTHHKITCETLLRGTRLEWCVLRVGVSVDSRTLHTDLATFRTLLQVRAGNPLEYVHPKDVAFAMCQALVEKDASKRVLLIGGGNDCQVTQHQFLESAINACGLTLNPGVFGEERFYTHWMNTEESQRILQYQSYGISDYQREMKNSLRYVRLLITPVRPIVNRLLSIVLKNISTGKW